MSRYLLSICFTFYLACTIRAGEELVVTASAGLRQTVESVRTFQSRLLIRNLTDGVSTTLQENFWQDGDKKRSRQSSDGGIVANQPGTKFKLITEAIVRNGRVTKLESVFTDGIPDQNQARISQSPRDVNFELSNHVWTGFGLTVTDMPKVWLAEVITGNREWTWSAKWADLNGVRTIHLQTTQTSTFGDDVTEVWLDPKEGYWPRKMIVYGTASKTTRDDPVALKEVTRFHPPYKQTGISFPATVKNRFRATDGAKINWVSEATIEIEDVRINEPIPDSTFGLTIPPNFWVIDRIAGSSYTMGENGKPKGTPQPIVPVPDSHPLEAETSGWSLSNYLLIAGGVIGCLAAARLWMKRRTASSQDAGVTS